MWVRLGPPQHERIGVLAYLWVERMRVENDCGCTQRKAQAFTYSNNQKSIMYLSSYCSVSVATLASCQQERGMRTYSKKLNAHLSRFALFNNGILSSTSMKRKGVNPRCSWMVTKRSEQSTSIDRHSEAVINDPFSKTSSPSLLKRIHPDKRTYSARNSVTRKERHTSPKARFLYTTWNLWHYNRPSNRCHCFSRKSTRFCAKHCAKKILH